MRREEETPPFDLEIPNKLLRKSSRSNMFTGVALALCSWMAGGAWKLRTEIESIVDKAKQEQNQARQEMKIELFEAIKNDKIYRTESFLEMREELKELRRVCYARRNG